jgi:hypothetical protein
MRTSTFLTLRPLLERSSGRPSLIALLPPHRIADRKSFKLQVLCRIMPRRRSDLECMRSWVSLGGMSEGGYGLAFFFSVRVGVPC